MMRIESEVILGIHVPENRHLKMASLREVGLRYDHDLPLKFVRIELPFSKEFENAVSVSAFECEVFSHPNGYPVSDHFSAGEFRHESRRPGAA